MADNVNKGFADLFYNKMLQKRYGINSCKKQPDITIIKNQKILFDISSYADISSVYPGDTTLFIQCKNGSCTLNPCTYLININPDEPIEGTSLLGIPIEVVVGSNEAIALGILNGSFTITNGTFTGKNIVMYRGNIEVPDANPMNGIGWVTKTSSSDTAILTEALVTGELIKIKIINNLTGIVPVINNIFPLNVVIGTPEANVLNIFAGNTTISNKQLKNRYVDIIRNYINLPSIPSPIGGDSFLKTASSQIIKFSSALQKGERIKIQIIA